MGAQKIYWNPTQELIEYNNRWSTLLNPQNGISKRLYLWDYGYNKQKSAIKQPTHNLIVACAYFVKIEENDTKLGIFFSKIKIRKK